MKRLIVAALALLALGTPAFAAPGDDCKTVADVVKEMSDEAGVDFKTSPALDAKQLSAALTLVKSHTKTPDLFVGDGAIFIVGGPEAIFIVFTTNGKACVRSRLPLAAAKAIILGDPDLADKPDTPPASAPAHQRFEHQDTTPA